MRLKTATLIAIAGIAASLLFTLVRGLTMRGHGLSLDWIIGPIIFDGCLLVFFITLYAKQK